MRGADRVACRRVSSRTVGVGLQEAQSQEPTGLSHRFAGTQHVGGHLGSQSVVRVNAEVAGQIRVVRQSAQIDGARSRQHSIRRAGTRRDGQTVQRALACGQRQSACRGLHIRCGNDRQAEGRRQQQRPHSLCFYYQNEPRSVAAEAAEEVSGNRKSQRISDGEGHEEKRG
jgi:hypothetical protein